MNAIENKIEALLESFFMELEEGRHDGAPFEKGKNPGLRKRLAKASKFALKEKGHGPAGHNAVKTILQTGDPHAVPADSKEAQILRKEHKMNAKDIGTIFSNRHMVSPKHKDEK